MENTPRVIITAILAAIFDVLIVYFTIDINSYYSDFEALLALLFGMFGTLIIYLLLWGITNIANELGRRLINKLN